ncbi:alpha/beta fold hydrolase [Burkholderia cepacia]|uniref:alpha/beta fold hydrolase n=1 Tax=Burkholderia cepacia TaxID=292 RepID=UPI002FDFCCCB
MSSNPEIGRRIVAGGIDTNYHDVGDGPPVLLIHGSGPGVTAYANWRLTMPALARQFRVIAPDMAGFGETERPAGYRYSMAHWVDHALGLLDALDVERAHVVGNSFGGALALALAIRAPERVGKLVLMGAAGTRFTLTEGLDAVWGYTPSIANMRALLDIFAFDRTLVNDELAKLRHDASVRPGYRDAFANMFPAPRQRWVDALASDETQLRALTHDTLIVHGREDRVIPLESSLKLTEWLPNAQLHVFGRCGHWTQIEHAARFNRLVIDHFNE